MTAMTEITRNGAKAARGLVSVQSRYNQIVDESSSTGKKLTAWYKEHNIAIKDQNGQLRSFYEVGGDVAKIWDTLSDNEKRYYLNTQAGANQSQNLAALMSNYGTAIDATNTALHSNNSASKENEKYKKSLKGSLQNLSSAWEDFSRKMVNSKAITSVLHGLTGVLRVLSSDAGQAAIKFGAFALAGAGIVKILPKIFAGFKAIQGLHLVGTFQALGSSSAAFIKAGGEINGVNGKLFRSFTKLTGAAKAFASTTTFAVGLPVALALASVALAKYVDIGASKKAKDANENFKETSKEVANLTSKLKANREEWKQLQEKQKTTGLSQDEEYRLAVLKQETEELKQQLAYKKALKSSQAEEKWKTVDPSKLTGSMKEAYLSQQAPGKSEEAVLAGVGAYNNVAVAVSNYANKMEQLQTAQKKVNDAQDAYNEAVDKYGDKSGKAKEALEKWTAADEERKKLTGEGVATTEASEKALNKLKKTQKELYEDYGGKDNFFKNAPDDLKKSARQMNRMINAAEGINKVVLGTKGYTKELKKAGKEVGILEKKSKKTGKTTAATIDAGKFTQKIIDAGGTKKQAKKALDDVVSSYEKDGAEVKLKVDGKNFGADVEKAMKGLDKEGKPIKVKAKVDADTKDAEAKLKTWGGKKDIGTRTTDFKGNTKDVYSKYSTWKGSKTIGTRYVEFKAKKVGKFPEKHGTRNFPHYAGGTDNAIVNEQGFEIIQSPNGAMRIANAGKHGATYIEEGSAVYTHGQSIRMLQKAGLTEADLLQGRGGDVGVFGVRKLEGFKKGKSTTKKKREAFDKELATLEYQRDYYNWTDSQFADKYKTLYGKYKKYLSTDQKRSYLVDTAETSRGYVQQTIEDTLELFENQQKTYKEMTSIVEKYYKDGKINAEEYADYIKEINKQQVENIRNNYDNQWDYVSQYIQRQIDLEEKNNDLLEAQGELLSATTQKVKVYKEGIGFVYEADEQAVKEAQQNLKSYSSVWEQISEIMDDVESQVNLQRAGVLAGGDLVSAILGAGANLSTWQNIIGLIGSNVGAYGLAGDLGIVDPSKISKATTINGQTFNIDNIALPSVTNANEFVTQLQTLAIQASSSRG